MPKGRDSRTWEGTEKKKEGRCVWVYIGGSEESNNLNATPAHHGEDSAITYPRLLCCSLPTYLPHQYGWPSEYEAFAFRQGRTPKLLSPRADRRP